MSHAFLSPSAAKRWMTCPAAPTMESLFPEEKASEFAAEGTIAHAMAAHELDPDNNPAPDVVLTGDDADHVKAYVDFVRAETRGALFFGVEVPLHVDSITHEPGAHGTADCLAVVGKTLKVIDLKFGRGVKVDALHNPQLTIYGTAALEMASLFHEIERVELVIYQPRLGWVSRVILPLEALGVETFAVREAAGKALEVKAAHGISGTIPSSAFNPTDDACRFCRAKAHCEAMKAAALAATLADFSPLPDEIEPSEASGDELARRLAILPLVESWVKATRDESYSRLSEGRELPGYKLVLGRSGPRRWASDEDAEKALKACRVKVADRYVRKLISPTQAQRLFKAHLISESHWQRISGLIVQPEGAPQVVPETDRRPAWTPVSKPEDFEPVTED